ncbi:nucleotidyltransferase domain-containing protein [Marinobacter adhaerens]|jgi:predicted nucleotidyltransferase|uniref:nucleotidyltransferase domain-containing protein n=1 Tax=Marinobacter adhaerens TaxID=1033846 RepID=UPI001E3D1EDF|nr:nucleotidyltransferase domain-containing protein [Marinobacter adhaerens]MCD1647645.1 nucleotidyltransferase domain-containing protein [Marinobacter adhaerens]
MKFSVIFGSQARGDFSETSDFDILLVNMDKTDFDYSIVPDEFRDKVDFVEYSEDEFLDFYKKGSLFLYHILKQGIVVDGAVDTWEKLESEFIVQNDFSEELTRIRDTSKMIKNISIFGGKYLTPLSNMFTELKNACIFNLAHKMVYEFNKRECLEVALPKNIYDKDLNDLKYFYDFVVRGQSYLPFSPNDEIKSEFLLETAVKSIEWLSDDCSVSNN